MLFKKLNLLMKTTSTTNAALAEYLSCAPSYIGRVREGKKYVAANDPVKGKIARFFSEKEYTPEQKVVISSAIPLRGDFPEDKEKLLFLLVGWLSENDDENTPVEDFLKVFGSLNLEKKDEEKIVLGKTSSNKAGYFYGDSGKKEAVLLLLGEALNLNAPVEILSFSDETQHWAERDPAFSKRLSAMLKQLVSIGSKIKVVVRTDKVPNDEFFNEIKRRLPLYFTGAVEPYYCITQPGIRLRKSFMVIKDFAAVTSQSLLDDEDSNFVQYIKNKRAVGAVERIFNGFAAKCKPLMRVYTQANAHTFFPAFKKLNEIDCALWFSSRLPSVATMPENIAKSIAARTCSPLFLDYWEERREKYSRLVKRGCDITETLFLPDLSEMEDGKFPTMLSDLYGGNSAYITKEELKEHLECVIKYLEENNHYRVVIKKGDCGAFLYILEGVAVTVYSAAPTTIFAFSQRFVNESFIGYFVNKAGEIPPKEKMISDIKDYISKL